MAFRDSLNRRIFGGIGLNVNSSYSYYFPVKEAHAFDRLIMFDYSALQSVESYDQPLDCRVYWYADGTNDYLGINKTAAILNDRPLFSVLQEEAVPEFPTLMVPALFMILISTVALFRLRQRSWKPNGSRN
jgi:hypothetical protein